TRIRCPISARTASSTSPSLRATGSSRSPFLLEPARKETAPPRMHIILLLLLLLALLVVPGVWVQSVMRRYALPADRYPRTGGQVARELLDSAGLRDVRVEQTERGDHYDPLEKVVRLSAGNFDGRSLTAVAVAAHEV